MNRRTFFGMGALFAAPSEHSHEFAKSPFWVTASVSFEEPTYYPPTGMIPVQMCKCGLIRIDPTIAAALFGKIHTQDQ